MQMCALPEELEVQCLCTADEKRACIVLAALRQINITGYQIKEKAAGIKMWASQLHAKYALDLFLCHYKAQITRDLCIARYLLVDFELCIDVPFDLKQQRTKKPMLVIASFCKSGC